MSAITSATRLALVIGAPVEHSASPAMHNAAFAATGVDAVFLAARVAPADLRACIDGLRSLRPIGVSVTVPHKREVLRLVDRVAAPADRIGAVNCLVITACGEIVGHNTDAGGFIDGVGDVNGTCAIVLGAGGAARAVVAGLRDAGAREVTVVARDPSRVDWVAAQPWNADVLAARCSACDLLVDCTSSGLTAATETRTPAPIPVDMLPPTATVATLVYHRDTALLARARRRKLRTVDGTSMLVHQGARAFTLWTGLPAPIDVMRRSLARA